MSDIARFVDDHRAEILKFQAGEDRFVWGINRSSGSLWHLEDGDGLTTRDYVKSYVGCPVPGCSASLTTVHSQSRRDHLRHLSGTGGHSAESVFHAQGCAVIEAWLKTKYPRSTVRREEYTNDRGERRADVLLTGPSGDRVAFEVQYSPLTVRAWRERHESYRRQGIVDVWLFGHQGSHLKLGRSGRLKASDTLRAVADSGAAVLFINPVAEPCLLAVAVGKDWYFDALRDGRDYSREPVDAIHVVEDANLSIFGIEDCTVDRGVGLTSPALGRLRAKSSTLKAHNEYQVTHGPEIRAAAERARQERQAAWQARREPHQAQIRELLGEVERWETSSALSEIHNYFGPNLMYLRERIQLSTATGGATAHLTQWQCVIYFTLIAGQSLPFGTREAHEATARHNVKADTLNSYRRITRYLYELRALGFLKAAPSPDRYPRFVPSLSGAWW